MEHLGEFLIESQKKSGEYLRNKHSTFLKSSGHIYRTLNSACDQATRTCKVTIHVLPLTLNYFLKASNTKVLCFDCLHTLYS